MEGMIASLLKDFEDGRMNRRQLIQSLAMVAVAGPAAAAAATQVPAPAKAPWTTVHLDHISYAVSDYKRSAEFYSNLMGWEVANDNGKTQATLKIGDIGEIIIRNARRPTAAEPSAGAATPSAREGNRPPVTGVINHVSWGIAPWDTEGVKAELERRGLNPRPDMVGSDFKSYHVLDPDGWDLQISNQKG
ncbi:MAG: VOC family protein [Acidobacteriota bacterium]|nr:VOC family protein [Acidobacteriota bacterium]